MYDFWSKLKLKFIFNTIKHHFHATKVLGRRVALGKKMELPRAHILSPILGAGLIKFFIFAKSNEIKFSLWYSNVVSLVDQSDVGKSKLQTFFRDL